MSQNNMYLIKNLNNSKSQNKTEGNYRMYKTKTEILPFNSGFKQNNKVYMKFEPENLKLKNQTPPRTSSDRLQPFYQMIKDKHVRMKIKYMMSDHFLIKNWRM